MDAWKFQIIKRKIGKLIDKDKEEEFEKNWDELCDLVDPLIKEHDRFKAVIRAVRGTLNDVNLDQETCNLHFKIN